MVQYLIFVDLDGTLLDASSKISEFTKNTLHKIESLGHKVIISTGRPYHSCKDYYEEINPNNPLIIDNGGTIRIPSDNGHKIIVDGIPSKLNHELFKFSQPYLVSAFYSYKDYVFSYQYLERLHKIFLGSEKLDPNKLIHCNFLDYDNEPAGLIYLIENQFIDQFEKFLKDHSNELRYFFWGKDQKHAVYEIANASTTKLSGVKYVKQLLNFPKENIIAFGDSFNDIEMISGVHHGVAMKNGCDEVKSVAKDITEFTNEEDGVAKYLLKYLNLK